MVVNRRLFLTSCGSTPVKSNQPYVTGSVITRSISPSLGIRGKEFLLSPFHFLRCPRTRNACYSSCTVFPHGQDNTIIWSLLPKQYIKFLQTINCKIDDCYFESFTTCKIPGGILNKVFSYHVITL